MSWINIVPVFNTGLTALGKTDQQSQRTVAWIQFIICISVVGIMLAGGY